jgi:hypothetical protein
MISDLREASKTKSVSYVPEFGLLDSRFINPNERQLGRVYRLTTDNMRALAEAISFTARFDLAAIKTAYADICLDKPSEVIFEFDRNVRPTELGLRYSRDVWSLASSDEKGSDSIRPWVRQGYEARTIPDKVMLALTEKLAMKPEDFKHFYLRLNFKDKIFALISSTNHTEKFLSGAYASFLLPGDCISVLPSENESIAGSLSLPEMESNASGKAQDNSVAPLQVETTEIMAKSSNEARVLSPQSGIKYATYSMSEIDRMMKSQAESITNSLSSRIGQQQRQLQETMSAQEHNFSKLMDGLQRSFEDSRQRFEKDLAESAKTSKGELNEFKSALSKELEQFKGHVNKNVLPISKTLDEKIAEFSKAMESSGSEDTLESLKKMVVGFGFATLACVLTATYIFSTQMVTHEEFQQLKQDLQKFKDEAVKH